MSTAVPWLVLLVVALWSACLVLWADRLAAAGAAPAGRRLGVPSTARPDGRAGRPRGTLPAPRLGADPVLRPLVAERPGPARPGDPVVEGPRHRRAATGLMLLTAAIVAAVLVWESSERATPLILLVNPGRSAC